MDNRPEGAVQQDSGTREHLGGWYAFVALYWTGFCAAGLSIIKPLIVGSLIDTYHYSAREAGGIASVEMICIGIGAFLLSSVGIGWQRRTAIRVGIVLGIVGSLAPLVAAHFAALFALRAIAGLGSGLIAGAVLATIARTRQPDRSFGLYFIFCYLLAAAMFPLAAAAILRFGADGSYYTLAIVLLTVFVSVLALPRGPLAPGHVSGGEGTFPFKPAILSLSVSVFFWIGNGAVWSFSERLGLRAGIAPLQVGTLLGLGQLLSMAGAGVAALLNTRWGRFIPTYAAIGLSILGLVLFRVPSMPAFTAAVLLISFAWTLFLTYLNGIMAAQDPVGRIAALNVTSQTVGMAIGPAVGGALAVTYGYEAVPLFGMAAHVIAAVMLGCLVLFHATSRSTLSQSMVQ